ncbi:MAG: 3-oxoadipyl-CoA thiolase [Pseudomonadota bacterium]
MPEAFICDAVRTPFGRFGGALSSVRADDLAVVPLKALMARHPKVDWSAVDDVIYGNVNQAGEDNRNVARMASLLAGLPETVSGVTVNRLCGSGLEAMAQAARLVRTGEADLVIAGGVESMSRAPFVMPKADQAFSRKAEIYDTTIGWRFVNPLMKKQFGVDAMPETAENLAEERQISRQDQDAYAWRSQQRAAKAMAGGLLDDELVPVEVPQRKRDAIVVNTDEHPRGDTDLDKLARLPAPFRDGGTVTAGNASGVNDGAGAMLIASENALAAHGLEPLARIAGAATAGVAPRIMGIGPAPAMRKLLDRHGVALGDVGVIELNEAFAAQVLAVTRDLGLADDAEHVNPNGGAIAYGHPLGASGIRLAATATYEMRRRNERYAAVTMCIGVGQGIAALLEQV